MERPRLRPTHRTKLAAFTLVELLVVIAIIGVLVGLLLPAVQAAREAARRTQCTNQVRQIMLGMINMESSRSAFPSGGVVPWPRLENYLTGTGGQPYGPEKQGLGWSFQILPYMENNAIYDLKTTHAVEAVVPQGFNCPSRRGPTQAERHSDTSPDLRPYLLDYAAAVPYRSQGQRGIAPGNNDNAYAMSGVDTTACSQKTFWGAFSNGPIHQGGMKTVTDLAATYYGFWGVVTRSNLCVGCSGSSPITGFYTKVSYSKIPDGSSNTMVIGEKALQPSLYSIGDWHDDKGYSGGWDTDGLRSTACTIGPDKDLPSNAQDLGGYRFGSAHSAIMNAGFADGSVVPISYDIDQLTFNRLGHRDDGAVVNKDDL